MNTFSRCLKEICKTSGTFLINRRDIFLFKRPISKLHEKHIKTLNGDITLSGSSHVLDDIVYKESESAWGKKSDNKPTLSISASVTVDGNIVLHRPVTLDIESDELKQKVIVSYSGAQ